MAGAAASAETSVNAASACRGNACSGPDAGFGARRVPYLAAKAFVDERALDREVRRAAADALRQRARDRGAARTLRALEVGAGAGDGFPRWMELAAPFERVEFTASDPSPALLRAHRRAVASWAEEVCRRATEADGGEIRIEGRGRRVLVRFVEAAAPAGLERLPADGFDLLGAQSVWDLTPPGTALRVARRLLRVGGVFYSTLTFCGVTRFDPPHAADRRILAEYHRSIEKRGGDPGAGARLAAEAERAGSGFEVLASGRSDWRVTPVGNGYAPEELRFVDAVLGFIEQEVGSRPDLPEAEEWLAARRAALAAGTLGFRAENRDLVAVRRPSAG